MSRTDYNATVKSRDMIIFLYGKDTYRSRQYLHKMMEKFRVERDPQGLNLTRIDCEHTTEPIMQEILSSPFLAEKRMVVVENLLMSKQITVQEDLLTRIEEKTLPQDVILIIWEAIEKPKTNKAKALFERLGKEQFTQHFEELTGVKVVGWVMAEVQERGGTIARDAATTLAHVEGNNMWRLAGLIDQLVSYAFGRTITLADVALFTEEKVDDNIFSLVDAIVQKQTAKAFTMIQEQYRVGNDAGYVFAMIVRQYRILLQLRDLYDRGEDLQSSALAKDLGIHPFVIKKSLPLVKRYTLEDLQRIHNDLLTVDYQTKRGIGSQSFLLDMFLSRSSI